MQPSNHPLHLQYINKQFPTKRNSKHSKNITTMNTLNIMKTLKGFSLSIIATIALFFAIDFQSNAKGGETDSTVISIDKRNQTLLNQSNNRTLKENIQDLFQKSGMTLDDDTWRGIRRIVNSDLNKDTLLVITQNDKTIKVVINTNTKGDNKTINSDSNWEKRSKDKKDKEVSVGLNGVVVKDGNDEVRVGWNGVYVNDGGKETNITLGDSTKRNRRDREFSSRSGFNIYLGLNSFTNASSIVAPYMSKDFELSPFGSRYFAMGWTRSGTISKGSNAAFKISYGLEFSWYNFMFENDNYLVKNNDNIAFRNYQDAQGNVVKLCRNKLTVANINIPVMPYVAFKKSSTVTYIAAGGYVGYRLDSYTKTKEDDSGKKQWNHSSFFLNNVRYGLAFELGLKNFPDLFVNYDLNNMFQDGRAPKVGGISFGIRL
jgi:Outer membrane protein beta-barrel domain